MKKQRVAVGLSGGVDSSVAAYLLKKRGLDVVGFTLKFYPHENRCCDLDSLDQAKRLCHFLDIPHYVLDVSDFFRKKVVDYFIQSYLQAETPNPCAYCNRFIKFGIFLEKIKSLNINYLATGHYARLVKKGGRYFFAKAKDNKKSQEYFLSLIEPKILKSLIFPLGDYTKSQVIKIAKTKKLLFKERKESQDICFITTGRYPEFVDQNLPKDSKYSGNIEHVSGNILGKHKGIHYYTLGQRSGLGIGYKHPLYVTAIDSASKAVIVGEKHYLYRDSFSVSALNWFTPLEKIHTVKGQSFLTGFTVPENYRQVQVKVRYNTHPVKCKVSVSADKVQVKLSKEIDSIAPGQVAVFYHKYILLGAGIIAKE